MKWNRLREQQEMGKGACSAGMMKREDLSRDMKARARARMGRGVRELLVVQYLAPANEALDFLKRK